jgi:hypothetical protein
VREANKSATRAAAKTVTPCEPLPDEAFNLVGSERETKKKILILTIHEKKGSAIENTNAEHMCARICVPSKVSKVVVKYVKLFRLACWFFPFLSFSLARAFSVSK